MGTALLLRHLRLAAAGVDQAADLRLRGGRIAEMGRGLAARRGERELDLAGCLALPGLINAHDHLDLDLLPRLGAPPYASFYDWAAEIFSPAESPLVEHRRVPLADRLLWGAARNLVAGVTTVMHHDPYHRRVFRRGFPLRVVERYAWAHSLGFAPDLLRRFRAAHRRPFVVHAAEGSDERARREIQELETLGVLSPRTVLVHGIALGDAEIELLARRSTSVVWCPASNLWLYGQTAPIEALRGRVPIALGTDSTISGSATLLDELRAAAATGLASPAELLGMVTVQAARVLRLDDGRGSLAVGAPADLLLLADRGGDPATQLLSSRAGQAELVTVDGEPRLASPPLAALLELGEPRAWIGGEHRWCSVDLEALRRRIEVAAGGMGAFAANPLWRLLGAAARGKVPATGLGESSDLGHTARR